ncbi:hypothetical protein C8J57DRAFT_1239931 [Mycena rebaudengoi]|nr:hypothetical protein C8J57DRAFT_1239931 [Mycena rebaudengoi]
MIPVALYFIARKCIKWSSPLLRGINTSEFNQVPDHLKQQVLIVCVAISQWTNWIIDYIAERTHVVCQELRCSELTRGLLLDLKCSDATFDPLSITVGDLADSVCDRCQQMLKESCDAVRALLWEELPRACELGDTWDTLRDCVPYQETEYIEDDILSKALHGAHVVFNFTSTTMSTKHTNSTHIDHALDLASYEIFSPWIADGTVVFEANLSLFKLYHGILAQQSTVFKDLLESAVPTRSQPIVDLERTLGCSVVVLDDDPSAMAILFGVLTDIESVTTVIHQPTSVLFTLCCVARKYAVHAVEKLCLSHLNERYPVRFDDFQQMLRQMQTSTFLPTISDHVATICSSRPDALGTVWLLPVAFYMVMAQSVHWDRYPTYLINNDTYNSLPTDLRQQMLVACISVSHWSDVLVGKIVGSNRDCVLELCREYKCLIGRPSVHLGSAFNPFFMDAAVAGSLIPDNIPTEEDLYEAKRELWYMLPKICGLEGTGLDSWDMLDKQRSDYVHHLLPEHTQHAEPSSSLTTPE